MDEMKEARTFVANVRAGSEAELLPLATEAAREFFGPLNGRKAVLEAGTKYVVHEMRFGSASDRYWARIPFREMVPDKEAEQAAARTRRLSDVVINALLSQGAAASDAGGALVGIADKRTESIAELIVARRLTLVAQAINNAVRDGRVTL